MKEEHMIPKKGLIVRDPITFAPLPEGGMIKPLNKYWRRRINCGDVKIKSNTIKCVAEESSHAKKKKPNKGGIDS